MHHRRKRMFRALAVTVLGLLATPAAIADDPGRPAMIGIIIDDMGYRLSAGRAWTELPGPLTFSFLPHAPHTLELSDMAQKNGGEVLLHLPMEADNNSPMGPGGLRGDMSEEEIARVLDYALTSVPHAIGINNHMGSRMTSDRQAVDRLMRAIRDHGNLFFIDSRTTDRTVAEQSATEHQVPTLRRDVFLDYEKNADTVRKQFHALVARAHKQGWAVAIAHPFPETLQVLREELGRLDRHRVQLVKISTIVEHRHRSDPEWQLSSSRSPRDAKSLKP